MDAPETPLRSDDLLLSFLLKYGRAYLACGGPTSRLEDDLMALGREMGQSTECFATPTGIFITCQAPGAPPRTSLVRIRESSIHMGRLVALTRLYQDVRRRETSLEEGLRKLEESLSSNEYGPLLQMLAAFVAGAAVSFETYGHPLASLWSGLLTVWTWMLGLIFGFLPSSTLKDFLGAFSVIAAAAFLRRLIPLPAEAFSTGSLLLIVPGLMLTTAISELADRNLVSGTAKLMQALLTLLALGLALLLVQEMAHALHWPSLLRPPRVRAQHLPFAPAWVSAALSLAGFGVLFQVPKRYLLGAPLVGLLGWFVISLLGPSRFAVAAPLLGSFAVGGAGLILARILKTPSQLFTVPGILTMLPGMLAFVSFRSFALGREGADAGAELAFQVLVTAVSIVFGLLLSRIFGGRR